MGTIVGADVTAGKTSKHRDCFTPVQFW